jgi:DNA-binding MarR family transcriptional regulator
MRREDAGEERMRTLAEFRYLLRRFMHFSEQAATEAGLTPQHHQLLLQVAGAPEGVAPTVSYLAERLVLRHNSVVELAARCEEAGWVVRRQDPANRRFVVLSLSAKGRRMLEQLSAAHAHELNDLRPELMDLLARMPGFADAPSDRSQEVAKERL